MSDRQSADYGGLVLPDDPIERHAAMLRLLGQQCLALADATERDRYPCWPETPIQLARRTLVEALASFMRDDPRVPACQDCGMRHDPADRAACIEGHGDDPEAPTDG